MDFLGQVVRFVVRDRLGLVLLGLESLLNGSKVSDELIIRFVLQFFLDLFHLNFGLKRLCDDWLCCLLGCVGRDCFLGLKYLLLKVLDLIKLRFYL